MKKNYPLRRWQSENERALLYRELNDLTLVIRPKSKSIFGKNFPTSWRESYFKKSFKSGDDALAFGNTMKSPFEVNAEEQGLIADLEVTYN